MQDSTLKRTCSGCKIEKPATSEFFHAGKKNSDGCREKCKECRASIYRDNFEAVSAKKKIHYQKNRERILSSVKEYYKENQESQRKVARERYHRNREFRVVQMREYRSINKEKIDAKRKANGWGFSKRYKVDAVFTLSHRTKSLVRSTLASGKNGKRMTELLGFSMSDLRMHLERQFTDGMTWDRFMGGEIHIDHILPIKSFGAIHADSDEFRACWALSNLRPMWAEENLSKGSKVLNLI